MKNLVDAETFLGSLASSGCVITPYAEEADLILVNTCSFIEPALKESLSVLRRLVAMRGGKRQPKVVAIGCMVQHLGRRLFDLVPGLWAAVGLDEEKALPELIAELVRKRRVFQRTGPARSPPSTDTGRLRLTPQHYAYLKVSEGCSESCTFCVIPRIRGPLRSKQKHVVVKEARELVRSGVRELVLIAQDLTAYGTDRSGKSELVSLLRELETLKDLWWIRLLYLHPAKVTQELISCIAESEKVLPCLDLPFQHAATPVLSAMGRGMTAEQATRLLRDLKEAMPHVVVRGTFLVGFPGEGEKEFRTLVRFLREAGIPRGGVFRYSPQEGTRAQRLKGSVPRAGARRRQALLRGVLSENARAFATSRIGMTLTVCVDELRNGRPVARSFAEAPDIDPCVLLPAGSARIGQFLQVTVRRVQELNVVAEPTVR